MADEQALHSVTADFARDLTRAHQISPIKDPSCTFARVGAEGGR